MVGAFAHGAIFFVRDYDPEQNKNNVLARVLEHKEAIISHLSWVSFIPRFPHFWSICSQRCMLLRLELLKSKFL